MLYYRPDTVIFQTIIIAILAAVALPLGYRFITRMPDELEKGRKALILIHALLSVLLIALLPWWQGALIAGLLLIGWLFALVGYAFLVSEVARTAMLNQSEASLGIIYYTFFLGIMVGTRWRIDEQNPLLLALGGVCITLLVVGVRAILLI